MSKRGGLVTLGETMALFRSARSGALTTQSDFTLSTGGAESNVAIGVSRLGVPAAWIGVVGDDPLGERVLRDLRAEGVRTYARVDPAATTGVMVKETLMPGRNRVTFLRRHSAGSGLSRSDVPVDLIAGADVLHVTGIPAALSTSAGDAVRAAVDIARRHEVTVSFDVNHRSALWNRDPGTSYIDLASRADILFAGEDEASLLVGDHSTSLALAQALRELGPGEVVLKRGAAGALALRDGSSVERPAHAIAPVDTVGAGDAFVAAYVATRIRGANVAACIDAAITAGASACLSNGDWEGSPTLTDLARFAAVDPVER